MNISPPKKYPSVFEGVKADRLRGVVLQNAAPYRTFQVSKKKVKEIELMSRGWKKVSTCSLCGKHGNCVQSTRNSRMYYCHRMAQTYFVNKNGELSGAGISNKRCKDTKGQESFVWGDIDTQYNVDCEGLA